MSAAMPQRFPYVEVDPILGAASSLPYTPITLQQGDRKVQVSGLIDSGSTLNVLPFDVGLRLGAGWEKQSVLVRLGGNMAESKPAALFFSGKLRDSRRCELLKFFVRCITLFDS